MDEGIADQPALLWIHGVEMDRRRLRRLCVQLARLGFAPCLQLWRSDGTTIVPRPPSTPDTDRATLDMYCWSKHSIGPQWNAFLNAAIQANDAGRYLGVRFDKCTPPRAVRSKKTIDLAGWTTDNSSAIATLAVELSERVERRRSDPTMLDQLYGLLGQIAASPRYIYTCLKRHRVLAAFSLALAIFGFLGTVAGNFAGICALWPFSIECDAHSWGNRAGPKERAHWQQIVGSDSCEAFDDFLARYGEDDNLAKKAQQRRIHPVPVLEWRTVPFERLIGSIELERKATRAAALVEMDRAASAAAAAQCARVAKATKASAARHSYHQEGSPSCGASGNGITCPAWIVISCDLQLRSDQKVCPPRT